MKILLWKIRNEKGMSLNQLSKATGIGKATLWRVENGEISPRMDTMEVLAKALNVGINDLYDSEYKFYIIP